MPAPRPIAELEAGQCFDLAADAATAVVAPDCGWAHDYEVAGILELQGDAYPGEAAVQTQADRDCADAFAAFAGRIPDAAPELRAAYLGPSGASWAAGDRALVCLIASADGTPRTASAAAPAGASASGGPTGSP